MGNYSTLTWQNSDDELNFKYIVYKVKYNDSRSATLARDLSLVTRQGEMRFESSQTAEHLERLLQTEEEGPAVIRRIRYAKKHLSSERKLATICAASTKSQQGKQASVQAHDIQEDPLRLESDEVQEEPPRLEGDKVTINVEAEVHQQ